MIKQNWLGKLSALTAVVALTACGGGGGESAPNTGTTPPATGAAPSPQPVPVPNPAPTPTPNPVPVPVPAPLPGPTSAASECFNSTLLTPGTTSRLDYSRSGASTGISSQTTLVGAPTTFNGISGVIPYTVITSTSESVGLTATFFISLDGFDNLNYGSTSNLVAEGGRAVSQSVNNPVVRSKRFALTTGGSSTSFTEITNRTDFSGLPPGIPTKYTLRTTETYLGQENITVPAGTYAACKFQTSLEFNFGTNGGVVNTTVTDWVSKGKGLTVRSVATGQLGTEIQELLSSSRLNGEPI